MISPGSLALLHRALRLDARLLHTHLFRFGFALVIYINLLIAHVQSLSLAAPGLVLFRQMTFLNLGLIALAGISFFATAISEEKEEDTLGLLKMAGIDPLGILLGKSTSRLIGTLLLLLVQFPFILLAITLGGVLVGQVLAVYCSLSAYLILLANVGLLASVVSRRAGNASGLVVLFLIGYFFVGPLLVGLARAGAATGALRPGATAAWLVLSAGEVLNEASVFTRVTQIMQTGFAGNPIGFQVLSNLGVAAVCFGLSWAGFERFTRSWRSTAAESRVEQATRRVTRKVLLRRPGSNPILWKEFHFLTGGYPVQIAKFVGYGIVTLGLVFLFGQFLGPMLPPSGNGATAAAGLMLMLLIAESSYYASRIFHDEWRDRTLPLLAMLPMPTSAMAFSKVLGFAPALVPSLFWLLVASAAMPGGVDDIINTLLLPSHWFWVLVALLFLTLTAFFSMVVRWGALPLALAVMLVGGSFGGCCLSPLLGILASVTGGTPGAPAEAAYLCVDAVLVLLIGGLQLDIHRRLEIVSSQ